ncbi:MAG: hypothetical protein AAFV29_16435, partial [Myxococcota bacterium]
MQSMRTIDLSKYAAFGVAAVVLGTGLPAAAQCLTFQGNQACAVGQANVSVNNGDLTVSGLRNGGSDGVLSKGFDASSWQTDMAAVGSSPGDFVRFTAMANGETASNIRFQRTTAGLRIRTGFTGASVTDSYSVFVLSQGQIVATLAGDSNTQVLAQVVDSPDFPWPFPYPFPGPGSDDDPIDFEIVAMTGGCAWTVSFANDMEVTVNGQQATGDQVRIVETVGPGHYPYAS